MIQVVIYKNHRGFNVTGHSGFAEAGSDIICAAVSTLVINTVNSLEQFTDDEFETFFDEDAAAIEVRFPNEPGKEAKLLLDSLVLGLNDVAESNGYVEIVYEEE